VTPADLQRMQARLRGVAMTRPDRVDVIDLREISVMRGARRGNVVSRFLRAAFRWFL